MKKTIIGVSVVLLSFCIVLLLSQTSIFKMYEHKTIDSRFYWRHEILGAEPDHKIRIIGIDDQSLLAMGNRWPIPWKWHALLLEALSDKIPAVVAYDILLQSASDKWEEGNRDLSLATRKMGDVVFPFYLIFKEEGFTGPSMYKSEEDLASEKSLLQSCRIENVRGDTGALPETIEATLPETSLAEAASLGFANAPGDEEDGVVRKIPLVLRYGDGVYPSFSLITVIRFYNVDLNDVEVNLGEDIKLKLNDSSNLIIPIDRRGGMFINHAARHNEFHNNLMVQVIQSYASLKRGGEAVVNLADFEDRIVLVGPTATGVVDTHIQQTPLSTRAPLLSVHANAISTILSGSFPKKLPAWMAMAILLLLGFIAFSITIAARPARSLIFVAILLAACVLTAYAAFILWIIIIPLIPGLAMSVLVYTFITSYSLATEERLRRFYRNVLGKYISRNVMDAILRNPKRLRLGGERKELTVLFADVKGFSRFCENSPAEAIAPRLNELHDLLTRVIWKHDGTLDKYMGDGVMAFWGAPIPQEDHPLRAVESALEIIEELKMKREEWSKRGKETFSIGIGINTGTMIVGNMGASDFWDYTVLGDEVNIGARLERLTRTYNVDIMISESTYGKVKEFVEATRIGEVAVRGRVNPVVIYQLLKPKRAVGNIYDN